MRFFLFYLALRLHYFIALYIFLAQNTIAWFGRGWYHEIDGTKQVTAGQGIVPLIKLVTNIMRTLFKE